MIQPAVQVLRQGSRRFVALGGLLSQALQADRLQIAGNVLVRLPQRRGIVVLNLVEQQDGGELVSEEE